MPGSVWKIKYKYISTTAGEFYGMCLHIISKCVQNVVMCVQNVLQHEGISERTTKSKLFFVYFS